MKLIVGLGNIGKSYSNTRHNVGFLAIDAILKDLNLEIKSNSFNCDFAVADINEEKVMFAKPTTLMNLSGDCVGPLAKFYKIKPEDIIVIHDDLDLELGKFRVRTSGSAGGHNGIKDIINKLGSDKFVRFKIGIGRPQKASVVDYVLGKLSVTEMNSLTKPINKAIEFVKLCLCAPINVAISRINQGSN